ncbi:MULTISPECIES: GHKL domain-containing protein [Enterococcus]|nr:MULTISPECIES: GHKL domain-containing protein [Enterococcus]MDB1679746.1 GHKL domain-containing protein [Enterococcus durans]
MAVILGYQIVEIIQRYTENRNLLFTLLIFYCLLSVLSITTVYALSQKKLLEEELNKHKVILELQEKYTNEIKKQYQETRKFRHDHANLLAAIHYYLENNEVAELKKFFFDDIVKSNEESNKNFFLLDELQNIGSLGVRGIFYTKLVSAQEKGIDIQVEINDFLSEEKKVRTSSLVRLFGIFLDNAIEELDSIQKGSLIIVGFEENNNSVFIIQNTIRDKIVPLQLLKKEGFSTRSKERGLGLVNVEEILLAEPNILLETKITDDFFIQRITIVSEVE